MENDRRNAGACIIKQKLWIVYQDAHHKGCVLAAVDLTTIYLNI